jgi:hypothetical protein
VFLGISEVLTLQLKLEGGTPGEFQRFFITAKAHDVSLKAEGQEPRHFAIETDAPAHLALGLADNGVPAEYMNIYVREIDGSPPPPR